MAYKRFFIVPMIALLFFEACKDAPRDEMDTSDKSVVKYSWQKYEGVNVACDIKEKDVKFLSDAGGKFMRFSTAVCTYMDLEEPYGYNESAFEKLDSVLDWGEKYGVDVLIDPHKYPGTMHQWTMLGDDPFFQDFKWHKILIDFWEKLAKQCAGRGKVVAGYDLLNEPQVDLNTKEGTPSDLNLLYKKLTDAIRKVDTVHTIVYALPRVYDRENDTLYGYHKGIEKFDLPNDDNICLETHTYMPVPFTHQNIWEEGEDVSYPGMIEGVEWDRQKLEEVQAELIAFSKNHPEIPILVGEFSSPRWTGEDGLKYLTDVIEIAEKNNWSWAYHAFRENQVWDPEMSITDRNDSIRIPNAPRWRLLKKYFNQQQE